MRSIIFMFLAHSVSIWNPTENLIWILAVTNLTVSYPFCTPHSHPQHFLPMFGSEYLFNGCVWWFIWALGLFVVVCDVVCGGLWCGLWWFVMFCGGLWCFVVFSATLSNRRFPEVFPIQKWLFSPIYQPKIPKRAHFFPIKKMYHFHFQYFFENNMFLFLKMKSKKLVIKFCLHSYYFLIQNQY